MPVAPAELGPVVRTEVIRVGDLGGRRRERLGATLLDIFFERYTFEHPQIVLDKVVFRDPEVLLSILYDADDSVLGFMSMGFTRFELGDRPVDVMDAGMYVRKGVRGTGGMAVRWAVRTCIRRSLRLRRVPLVYVGEATSPVSYARALREWPEVWPRQGVQPPAETTALVRQVMAARGFQTVDGDPWRVRVGLPFGFRDPERILATVRDAEDPALRWFVERNPGYLQGDWLALVVPYSLGNLVGAVVPPLRGRLSNAPGRAP